MTKEDFIIESDSWMESLGYSLHHRTGDNTSRTYSSDKQYYPPVATYYNDGDPKCEVLFSLKVTFTCRSGELQFKHPNIDLWINYGRKLIRRDSLDD